MTEASNGLHIVCPHCDSVNRVAGDRLSDRPRCGRCKEPLFVGRPMVLHDQNFEKQTTRSDIPVVVDFWAPWCGPCKMMAPAFEQATAELEPQVRMGKLNTEESQGVAARFGIQSIPTLMVFRNGREVARQPGAMDRARLAQWVRAHTG